MESQNLYIYICCFRAFGANFFEGILCAYYVYMHKIAKEKLRNTLFVLWFFLVTIKMGAFVAVGVHIDWQYALMFLPAAAVGHYFGLKAHAKLMEKDQQFKRWLGGALIFICAIGMARVFLA